MRFSFYIENGSLEGKLFCFEKNNIIDTIQWVKIDYINLTIKDDELLIKFIEEFTELRRNPSLKHIIKANPHVFNYSNELKITSNAIENKLRKNNYD